MVRFLFVFIIIFLVIKYIKKVSKKYYFYATYIKNKYNLIAFNFINLNNKLEKNYIVILMEDLQDFINIFEECYISEIEFDIRRI